MCCKGYRVVLNFNEWVNIGKKFGFGTTTTDVAHFYLGKKVDGTCVFLSQFFNKCLCGIQTMKPTACKLWPFKILTKPKFGRPKEAAYKYENQRFYIYVDPACIGVKIGKTSQTFIAQTIPEFIAIALGDQKKQYYSTSKIPYVTRAYPSIGRRLI
jgi:hypothetical protein